jgi:hypothetical protein
MKEVFKGILDWLEVWALFIPIAALFKNKKQPAYLRPVVIYLFVALFLNLLIDISWKGKIPFHFPEWFQTNTYLYNILSIMRLFLFSLFFIRLNQPFLVTIKKVLPLVFLIFIIINFGFFENFFYFKLLSSRLHSVEAGILLFYCLQYYLYMLNQEQTLFSKFPSFWVVTGLSILIITSFPIYLFYNAIVHQSLDFAYKIWPVQKVALLIFCILIAKAFYQSKL